MTERATQPATTRWSSPLFGREPHCEPAVRGLQEPPRDFWDRGVRAEAVDESAEDRQEDRGEDVGDEALVEVHAVSCQLVVTPPRRPAPEIGHVCVLGSGGSQLEPGRAGGQQERTRFGAARTDHHGQAAHSRNVLLNSYQPAPIACTSGRYWYKVPSTAVCIRHA